MLCMTFLRLLQQEILDFYTNALLMIALNNSLKEFYKDSYVSDLLSQYEIKNEDLEKQIDLLCNEKGIDSDFFIEILKIYYDTNYFPKRQLMSFPLSVILDYLHKTHGYYIRKRLLDIEQAITVSYPDPVISSYLQTFFVEFKEKLVAHISEEENVLFPYIRTIEKFLTNQIKEEELMLAMQSFSIEHFEERHNHDIENSLQEIRRHIIEFCKDVSDLFPYRILLRKMESFEFELRVHARVEDEVLIPVVRLLEKGIKQQYKIG